MGMLTKKKWAGEEVDKVETQYLNSKTKNVESAKEVVEKHWTCQNLKTKTKNIESGKEVVDKEQEETENLNVAINQVSMYITKNKKKLKKLNISTTPKTVLNIAIELDKEGHFDLRGGFKEVVNTIEQEVEVEGLILIKIVEF